MSHVLVVDDDTDFVKAVAKVLQRAGHEVTSASNGERALATLRQSVPDLVLLDMIMSYILDGLDVRQAMIEDPVLKTVPVVMVTSVTTVRAEDPAPNDDQAPVTLWLSKPIDPEKLLATVSRALA